MRNFALPLQVQVVASRTTTILICTNTNTESESRMRIQNTLTESCTVFDSIQSQSYAGVDCPSIHQSGSNGTILSSAFPEPRTASIILSR